MPRFHFGSVDFAKDKAKALRKALKAEGRDVPLGRCQDALSRACGYDGWPELLVVTRSRSHPMSAPGDLAPDVATFASSLGIDIPVAEAAVATIMPRVLPDDDAIRHDDVLLLTLMGSRIPEALKDMVRHVDDRFLFCVRGTSVPAGSTAVHLEDLIEGMGWFGEMRETWRKVPTTSLVEEAWISLLRRIADNNVSYENLGYGDDRRREELHRRHVLAMSVSSPMPAEVEMTLDVLQQPVRFRIAKHRDGIEATVLDRVQTIATGGFESSKEIFRTIEGKGIVLVIGDRGHLLDVLSSMSGRTQVDVVRDPDDGQLLEILGRQADSSLVIGLPDATPREAYLRIYEMIERYDEMERVVTTITVEQVPGRPGRWATTELDVSMQTRMEPFVPPRRLTLSAAGVSSLPISGAAGDALRRIAVDECSVFVHGKEADEVVSAVKRHRLDEALHVAAATTDLGQIDGPWYVGTPDTDWKEDWRSGHVMGHVDGENDPDADSRMWWRMSTIAEASSNEMETLRGRRAAFVGVWRFGRPCPHCSTTFEASWAMGDDVRDLEACFDADLLRAARYRYPFGCPACRKTGFLGKTYVLSVQMPSFDAFVALKEAKERGEKLRGDARDPRAQEWRSMPRLFSFDPVADARTVMQDGLLDPLDWMQYGVCAAWQIIHGNRLKSKLSGNGRIMRRSPFD